MPLFQSLLFRFLFLRIYRHVVLINFYDFYISTLFEYLSLIRFFFVLGDSQLSSNYDQPKTVLKVTTSPLPSKRGYSPSRTCSPDLHGGQRSMDTSSQRSGFRSPGSSLSSPPLTPRSLR